MPVKPRPKRSTRKTTKVAQQTPRVNPDGSGDAAPRPTTRGQQKASSPVGSTATTTLVKSKRTPPAPAPRPQADRTGKPAPRQQPPVSALRTELEMAADQAVQTRGSFAAKFAEAVRTLHGGVTIGIDKDLNVSVIRKASEEKPDVSTIADSLKDRRLDDLDETVRQFMADSRTQGVPAAARARFAAAVLGVTAASSLQVDRVADTTLEGLRARLHGQPPKDENLPRELVALLNDAAQAWTSTSDADFWRSLAATAQRPAESTPEGFLREQGAWMGLVARLSAKDVKSPWRWASAAEKAYLVDRLIDAGTAAPEPVQAILARLSTLTRGPDPLPRAIAAELAQLALAALPGVKKAMPNRRDVLLLKEGPPGPDATPQEQAAHWPREALRDVAHSLVDTYDVDMSPSFRLGLVFDAAFHAGLFRSKLSTLYTEQKEWLRLDSGEERYRKLMDMLGPLDRDLTEALDEWSAAIGSGATAPARFVQQAFRARAAIENVLRTIQQNSEPESRESAILSHAVRSLAVELGLEAGEVLTGQVAPTADPMAGVRHQLTSMREDQRLLERWRDDWRGLTEDRLTVESVRRWVGTQLKVVPEPRWLDDLSKAVAAIDTASRAQPADPAALTAAVDQLLRTGDGVRQKTTALTEATRQPLLRVLDVLQAGVADRLEHLPPAQGDVVDHLGPEIARLRAGIPTLPVPPPGVGLDHFWSQQKAAALALLPSADARRINNAMNLDLAKQLAGLAQAAAAGDADTIEAQAWPVVRTLGEYRNIVKRLRLPDASWAVDAQARARLLAALDGVALSALRLLPPPTPTDAGQDG